VKPESDDHRQRLIHFLTSRSSPDEWSAYSAVLITQISRTSVDMRFRKGFVCDCVPMKVGTELAECHVIACRTLYLTDVFRPPYCASAADPFPPLHVLSNGCGGRRVGCLGCSCKTHVIASAGFKPTVSIIALRRDMATVWIAVI